MGNLPPDRLRKGWPFRESGLDFCEPFYVSYKVRGKPPVKTYYMLRFVPFASNGPIHWCFFKCLHKVHWKTRTTGDDVQRQCDELRGCEQRAESAVDGIPEVQGAIDGVRSGERGALEVYCSSSSALRRTAPAGARSGQREPDTGLVEDASGVRRGLAQLHSNTRQQHRSQRWRGQFQTELRVNIFAILLLFLISLKKSNKHSIHLWSGHTPFNTTRCCVKYIYVCSLARKFCKEVK